MSDSFPYSRVARRKRIDELQVIHDKQSLMLEMATEGWTVEQVVELRTKAEQKYCAGSLEEGKRD